MANQVSNTYPNSGFTRQVIIQCPTCQTKFALESASLEGVQNPKFHCSRCDNIFRADSLRKMPPAKSIREDGESSPDVFGARSRENRPSGDGVKIASRLPSRTAFSITGDSSSSSSFTAIANAAAGDKAAQIAFPFTDDATPAPSSLPAGVYEDAADSGRRKVEEIGEALEAVGRDPTPPSVGAAEIMAVAAAGQAQNNWRSLALLAAALFVGLTLLAGTGFYLGAHPALAMRLSATSLGSSPRVAPQGLFIRNSDYKRVVLDSGDSVFIVSGQLVNQSGEAFSEVLVEAIAFDALGKPLVRTKVLLGSTLAKTNIKPLTLDLIKTIQTNKPAQKAPLGAGKSAEFAVALDHGQPGSALAQAKFFSARVFSVRS